jgi:hypothetical protein
MTTPNIKRNWFFVSCLLLLPGLASADTFEISCRELNASPDKNLPAPYKAVWDGSILTQIATDSAGKTSQSAEKVVAAKRLPTPDDKGIKYSFITGIEPSSKRQFLSTISVEPSDTPDEFAASVSYAAVDSDGFLIDAFEVVNEKCSLATNITENSSKDSAAPASESTP